MTDLEAKFRDYALAVWPGIDWTRAEVRVGAFHTVIIAPTGSILRVTTGNHFDVGAQREARTLQAMARIALPVPVAELRYVPSVRSSTPQHPTSSPDLVSVMANQHQPVSRLCKPPPVQFELTDSSFGIRD